MKPREPLAATPPAELKLSGRAKQIYSQFAKRLRAEGFASAADARTVALASMSAALVERMEEEVAALSSLTVHGSTGQTRPHPLLGELRSERAHLASLLGALFMTPRARSSARMTEAQMRGRVEEPEGDESKYFAD